MKPRCERVTANFLPLLRALVAKELVEKYGMTQQEAAKLLNVTQGAVSQYLRGVRGKGRIDPELVSASKRIADALANGNLNVEKYICELCRRKFG